MTEKQHVTDGGPCWCNPRVLTDEGLERAKVEVEKILNDRLDALCEEVAKDGREESNRVT